jgi:glutaredoxin-like protein NrdH
MGMQEAIKMYTLSTCGHCKATKRFLDECNIEFEFEDVDLLEGEERAAILEEVKKWNPSCSFPTIIIGDKVIVGFKEKEIREALGL